MNFAEPVALALTNPVDGFHPTTALKSPANRASEAAAYPVGAKAVPTSDERDHEESGCVCRNCSGKGDCGRNR